MEGWSTKEDEKGLMDTDSNVVIARGVEGRRGYRGINGNGK